MESFRGGDESDTVCDREVCRLLLFSDGNAGVLRFDRILGMVSILQHKDEQFSLRTRPGCASRDQWEQFEPLFYLQMLAPYLRTE